MQEDDPPDRRPHDPASSRAGRSGQSRGDDTRRRILTAALDVFSAQGYEGTTTRQLADVAQVTLPSIQYYFGSKEGLYRAVVAYLVETMEDRVGPEAERVLKAQADGPLTREKALTLLCSMLDAFTALVADQTAPDWLAGPCSSPAPSRAFRRPRSPAHLGYATDFISVHAPHWWDICSTGPPMPRRRCCAP